MSETSEDFKFSEVKLEFQSQTDGSHSDDSDTNQSQFTQKTVYDTVSQSQTETENETETQTDETAAENSDTDNLDTTEETEAELGFEESFEQYDFDKLPEHACSYCGIHSPDCVVQCGDCQRWFCNSRGATTGAHIINHLVRALHKRVVLHRDCLLGSTALECFNCGGENVFLLGFIPAKANSIVVLLCREPCLSLNSLKEMNWDLAQWVPLIRDRAFLPWLVQPPPPRALSRALPLSAAQMRLLEERWRRGDARASAREVARGQPEAAAEPVRGRYDTAYDFERVFAPLIDLERDVQRRLKEEQSQRGVTVRWELAPSGRRVAVFRLDRAAEHCGRIAQGDELRLAYGGDVVNRRWHARCVVLRTTASDEVVAELGPGAADAPLSQSFGFDVDFVFKPVPYDRMKHALHCFAADDYSLTGYLYHALLGHDVAPQRLHAELPPQLGAPGLPALNSSQAAAVRHALQQPLSLVQGPPGTGKTVTAAVLVFHLARQGRGRLLVCAPSNIGADHLATKMHAAGLRVVRLDSRSREMVSSFADFLYLSSLARRLSKETGGDVEQLESLRDMQGKLNNVDEKRYKREKGALESELLNNAEVVCTTCVGAGDPRLRKMRFKQVVIDESTQAAEPEAFIPIAKGAKQIVLIGDHCQLGPVVLSKKAMTAGLHRSLFERLIMLGIRPMRLQVQYRMHPALSEFPSNTFYEGSLQNGISVEERKPLTNKNFFWPDPETPMFFYSSLGQEEFSASGTSYLNRLEAVNVEKIVTKLLQSGITPQQIGVITPYEGQRQYVLWNMQRTGTLDKSWYEEIEVASVDAFQGREKDYIILSCVRSNENLGIGFLSDPRRLNVALTRAKFGLVLIGNPRVLSVQPLWYSLLSHFKKQHLIVEGPLDNLTEFVMKFSQPKGSFERRRLYAERDDEDRDYFRQQISSGAGLAGDSTGGAAALQTPYSYAHPGEIRAVGAQRPPAVNRRQRSASFGRTQSQTSFERTQEGTLSQANATEDDFETQSAATESGCSQSQMDFTQHLHSQMSGLQTQPESQVDRELGELSLGAFSQDLDDLSQTDSDAET